MSVVVIGLNHRTAPLELLERATVVPDALPKVLQQVASRPDVVEAVVLSTCNRTEVYAVVERFHPAYQDLRDLFCDLSGVAPEGLVDHLYTQHDDDAVRHLFTVAAGLDSDVLGESEILGQVRDAWDAAREEGVARSQLHLLFRHALEVGKRARTETAIARSTASVSHAAVEMAREHLGTLAERRVLVIGAGEVGQGLVVALAAAGVGTVTVANRSLDRAEVLAARVGGRAIPLDAVLAELEASDVLLTCTGAGVPVVHVAEVAAAMAARAGRPLLVVDVGVPRDVEHRVVEIPGVTCLDLDDLQAWADRGRAERRLEAAAVERIVTDEVERFAARAGAREVAPLLAALHERGEALRQAELERFRSRLGSLDERQQEAVEQLTRGLVAKLLHEPTVRLKEQAGTGSGERAARVLRELFDLDETS